MKQQALSETLTFIFGTNTEKSLDKCRLPNLGSIESYGFLPLRLLLLWMRYTTFNKGAVQRCIEARSILPPVVRPSDIFK